MKKRIFCIIAYCLLAIAILGCGNSSAGSEKEVFTLWLYSNPNDYYSDYSENPVVQYLNQKFNVTLKYEQPVAGTEQDALSLMFGTQTYTDVIDVSYYTGSVSQLFDDGVIIDIADYLDYMPNFKALLDADPELRRDIYDDDGRILKLTFFGDSRTLIWIGLAYRNDILETMTGGNVVFPSGNPEPVTVEDWEYMLPLFKSYFEMAGMVNYAPLIIPYNGYFAWGDLHTGFGFSTANVYVQDGTVYHGLFDTGLYDYLTTMNKWFQNGWIYQDFASRSSDPFYLPNTELTYGGAAGAWYGFPEQLGDSLSMPEYGLNIDLRAAKTPLFGDNKPEDTLSRDIRPTDSQGAGVVITKSCDNIPRLLSILDHMYTEEGSMLAGFGFTKEQLEEVPAAKALYEKHGLSEGAYWFDNGKMVFNPLSTMAGGSVGWQWFASQRLPQKPQTRLFTEVATERALNADAVWGAYSKVAKKERIPSTLSFSIADSNYIADVNVQINDYINAMLPKFIMGTEPLTERSFNAFINNIKSYNIERCIELQQAAYDRFIRR